MRRRLAGLAALVLAPLAAHAQAPTVPADLFGEVLRTFAFQGCHAVSGACFTGHATWGQRAGTSDPLGLALWIGVRADDATSPPFSFQSIYGFATTDLAGAQEVFTSGPLGTQGAPEGPFATTLIGGGHFPTIYALGASPASFRLDRIGLEYQYQPAGGPTLTTDASFAVTVNPEPGTWAMLTVGGLALAGVARRRARA